MKPTLENIKAIVSPEMVRDFEQQQDKFLFCLYTLESKGFNLPRLNSYWANDTEKACETLESLLAGEA